MKHRWEIHDSDHRHLRTTGDFESRSAAEDWLRDNWESLVADGAGSVVLRAGDRVVYEMGLEPA
jgi:hypothetical protein